MHRDGRTERATSLDRRWLARDSATYVWVDLAAPSIPETLILSDTFAFHPLSVEDAISARQYPKVEAYDAYVYAVLHEIDFHTGQTGFATHDVDFFLGANYLVTVHDGHSTSINELRDHAVRNAKIVGEGPVVLLHRIVDAMVDQYRPQVEKLDERLDDLEKRVFKHPSSRLVREILSEKRAVSSLRRIVTPQRDVVARLARREFVDISAEMAFRFRDIYDHLVRISDDALIFQDRITGILEAHLTNASNRLNEVMKVLTVVSTIFMPLTLLVGLYGVNFQLPHLPGGEAAQFWWLVGIMIAVVAAMLAMFRRLRWL